MKPDRQVESGRYRLVLATFDPVLASAIADEDVSFALREVCTIDKAPPRTLEEELYMHWRRALIALHESQWAPALTEADFLATLHPKSVDAQLFRSHALGRLGRLAEARQALGAAIALLASGDDPYGSYREEMHLTSQAALREWAATYAAIPPDE